MTITSRRAIAVHPGEILQEILDQNQITQSLVAERLGMAQSKISDICRGKRGMTPDMAMRLGRLFGQNPRFWLNMQENWELSQLNEAAYAGIEPIHLQTAV
ncbi:MAG: HigA family addiction module antitoxin [Anaerolineae bacterium]|nr:HigA family addiction module antidote protein [Anaerolineae bacterium]MBK9231320.1 HigA family addiction module antidote protein [Anaerolineae bacterium]